EYGRTNVFKVEPDENEINESSTVASVGGRSLFRKEISLNVLDQVIERVYVFRMTPLTHQYTYKQYIDKKSTDILLVYVLKKSKQIYFYTQSSNLALKPDDMIASLTLPNIDNKKNQQKLKNPEKD